MAQLAERLRLDLADAFASDGEALAGTPIRSGTFNFTIAVADALNCQGARGFTLTINSATVAAVASLSPGFAIAGGNDLMLMVNGVNFAGGMIVRWNGADRAPSFISSTELRAAIPASDLTGNGRASVRVFNPATGANDSRTRFPRGQSTGQLLGG